MIITAHFNALNRAVAVAELDGPDVALTLVEGGSSTRTERGTRPRLLAVNKAAAVFYAEQLQTPGAQVARDFLAERGFDLAAAAHFGWTPHDLDAIAGAMAAGHVIECGTQATGGNYAFFRSLETAGADLRRQPPTPRRAEPRRFPRILIWLPIP